MQIGIRIENAAQMEKRLLLMEPKVARKLVRSTLRNAARPIHARAKTNAVSIVGGQMGSAIASSLKLRAKKKRRRGEFGVSVSFDTSKHPELVYQSGSQQYFVPAAVEYGHALPGRGGGKNPPKDVAAMPFLRPAFDSESPRAATVFETELRQVIDEAWMR